MQMNALLLCNGFCVIFVPKLTIIVPKFDAENPCAYFKLFIPECALVFVFLTQKPWAVLADLICLLCSGCRGVTTGRASLLSFLWSHLWLCWHLFFQCGSKLLESASGALVMGSSARLVALRTEHWKKVSPAARKK